jgi:hypothetical protein
MDVGKDQDVKSRKEIVMEQLLAQMHQMQDCLHEYKEDMNTRLDEMASATPVRSSDSSCASSSPSLSESPVGQRRSIGLIDADDKSTARDVVDQVVPGQCCYVSLCLCSVGLSLTLSVCLFCLSPALSLLHDIR